MGLLALGLGILSLIALAVGTVAAQAERYIFAAIFGLMGVVLVIGSVSVFCQLGTEHTTLTYSEACNE